MDMKTQMANTALESTPIRAQNMYHAMYFLRYTISASHESNDRVDLRCRQLSDTAIAVVNIKHILN